MKVEKEEVIYRESHLRSLLKTLSWRFTATCTTFAIVYLITGELSFATSVAGVEVITKMIIYYFHERAWQLLPRGSVRKILKKRKKEKLQRHESEKKEH